MHRYKKYADKAFTVIYWIDCIATQQNESMKRLHMNGMTKIQWTTKCLSKTRKTFKFCLRCLFIYLCIFLLLRFKYVHRITKHKIHKTNDCSIISFWATENRAEEDEEDEEVIWILRLVLNFCIDKIRIIASDIDVPPYKVVINKLATNIIVIDTYIDEWRVND